MSDPQTIQEIQEAVSIPVMAKCRIGHFVEAQILEALRSTTSTSPRSHASRRRAPRRQHAFTVPFVCGATNLGEASAGSPRALR